MSKATPELAQTEAFIEAWIRTKVHVHAEPRTSVVIGLAHIGAGHRQEIKRWRYRLDKPEVMAKEIVERAEKHILYSQCSFVVEATPTGGVLHSIRFKLSGRNPPESKAKQADQVGYRLDDIERGHLQRIADYYDISVDAAVRMLIRDEFDYVDYVERLRMSGTYGKKKSRGGRKA